jgi:hypothetical protein
MDPNVITAAASSPLGILALLILVLASIATVYFREAPVNVRVWMFVLMFVGVALFAFTVVKRSAAPQTAATTNTLPPGVPSGPLTPARDVPAAGQLIPDSSDRPLQPADLANLSAAQLRIARNEIYARHGYIFQSPDLREHFARFIWYKPALTTVALSPVEQQNVALFRQAEAARGQGGG